MAGLVQAIHVVRRIERMRARSTGGKLCVYRSLQSATPMPAASLGRRRVDGRYKLGHDGGVQSRSRKRPTDSERYKSHQIGPRV
jgi:hypothetical protein